MLHLPPTIFIISSLSHWKTTTKNKGNTKKLSLEHIPGSRQEGDWAKSRKKEKIDILLLDAFDKMLKNCTLSCPNKKRSYVNLFTLVCFDTIQRFKQKLMPKFHVSDNVEQCRHLCFTYNSESFRPTYKQNVQAIYTKKTTSMSKAS